MYQYGFLFKKLKILMSMCLLSIIVIFLIENDFDDSRDEER